MKKRPIRKQSSSRVSSLAAHIIGAAAVPGIRFVMTTRGALAEMRRRKIPVHDATTKVTSLCASVLSQDETKGQARKAKAKRWSK